MVIEMSNRSEFNAELLRFAKAEEQVLKSRLEAARTALPPSAEKDRSIGAAVWEFLRGMLPAEYGLGRGFIASHAPACLEEREYTRDGRPAYECRYRAEKDEIRISAPPGLIVYDALRFSPLVRLEACDVYPAEAVYAHLEIRSSIDNKKDRKTGLTALESILVQSRELRAGNVRLYHVSIPGAYTRTVLVPLPPREGAPIHPFVFVLEAGRGMGAPADIRDRLEELNRIHHGFLSGMYIRGKGFYQSVPPDPAAPGSEPAFALDDTPAALARFKQQLFISLSRHPRPPERWTPAVDRYFTNSPVTSPVARLIQKPGQPHRTLQLVFYRQR